MPYATRSSRRVPTKRRPMRKRRIVRRRGRGDNGYNPRANKSLWLNQRSRVNKQLPSLGFPHEYYVCLPYHEVVSLSLSAIPWQLYRFRMNSIADPNFSGGGHQPLGHDEFGVIYNSYIVYAIGYDVNFMTKDTTRESLIVGVAGCSSSQGVTSLANYQQLRENDQRYVRYTRIDDQKPTGNIRGKLMCRKVEGVDKDTYN